MAIMVNVYEAKTPFPRLLEQAHAGQEIVLAKAGKSYARLMPFLPASSKRQAGRLLGRVESPFFDSLPDDELAAWEGG